MWTAAKIKRFIAQLPRGQMFCSMELVHMGPRWVIDNTTCHLVKIGAIIRLAWGVFVRRDAGLKLPSQEEIVKYKAKIFQKRIFVHGSQVALDLGLRKGPVRRTYATNGCTSSYLCLGERVYFHGLSQRKVGLDDSKLGLLIRAMWHIKEEIFAREHFGKAIGRLNAREMEEIRTKAKFMPGWLIQYFSWGSPISREA